MYGVPANLDLGKFKGDYLTQIRVGEFQIQFVFPIGGTICVEGLWQLRDSIGTLIDEGKGDRSITEKAALRLHTILGKVVSAFSLSAPKSFSLHFNSGHVLTVFDDSDQYESFSIGNFIV